MLMMVVLTVAAFVLTGAGAANARRPVAAPTAIEVYTTYYGWYDNTPPGCATAYKPFCARGIGTYADPITFASFKKEFPVGTILYYPTLEKYFVMGDLCQECQADWVGEGPDGGPRLYHLDLWIGGKSGNEFDVINCEDALTQATPSGKPLLTPFIENPPQNLPVSTESIFDAHTNHCFGGVTTSATHGRYANAAARKCLDDSAPTPGAPVIVAPCSSASSEKLSFEGAFFVVNKLCLNLKGATYGSALDWATCTGNDRQQWEIGTSGTIAWIQYLRCVGVTRGKVVLSKCNNKPSVRWGFTPE